MPVAWEKEEVALWLHAKKRKLYGKTGIFCPRAGPQTWGTILGVKKLSSRETPGNKLPGAYAKNLPRQVFFTLRGGAAAGG